MAKILIVEDDPTSVKLLKILLEEVHGHQVFIARHGAQVLAMATQTPPDIFLVDYHLMDMDGITLIKLLRATEVFAKTPIIMASGMDVEHEAVAAGANKFLTKPYEPDELSNLFNTLTAKPAASTDGAPSATQTDGAVATAKPETPPAQSEAPAAPPKTTP